MTDYESIYRVITPSGVFEAVWGEEPLPIEYRGDPVAILNFKNFLALNHVSGEHGILLNEANLTPDELYNFCQPTGSGIIVIPPLDDMIAYDQEERLLNQEADPVLDSTQESTMQVSGIEKLKLAKELNGIRSAIKTVSNGLEKLQQVKRIGEIRVLLGGKKAGNDGLGETDPNIGREWNSKWGRQRIVGIYGGDLYEVQTIGGEGDGVIRRYSVKGIEETIKRNEYELTPEFAQEVADRNEMNRLRAERDARQKAADEKRDAEISEFTKYAGMNTINAEKARLALIKQVSVKGIFTTRKTWMEDAVAKGYEVVHDGNERRLTAPDGSFFDEKSVTKTAMDYASYLIVKNNQESEEVTDKQPPATQAEAAQALKYLKGFIGQHQLNAIATAMRGEEKQFFFDKVVELEKHIKAMPKTYDQDGLGDKAVAYLHYFKGNGDWYITERDMEDEQLQAYGLANLGYGGEMGYISIVELIKNNVELDLYWTPKTIRVIKGGKDDAEDKTEFELAQEKAKAEYEAQEANKPVTIWERKDSDETKYLEIFTKGGRFFANWSGTIQAYDTLEEAQDQIRYWADNLGIDDVFGEKQAKSGDRFYPDDIVYMQDITDENKRIPVNFRGYVDDKMSMVVWNGSQMQVETSRLYKEDIQGTGAVTPTPEPTPEPAPVVTGNTELDKQRAKLKSLTDLQDRMKSANKVVNNKKLSDDQKVEQLMAQGFDEHQARELLKPDYAGRTGFASYQLTNNNAVIKNTQKRIEQLEAKELAESLAASGERETSYDFDGGTIDLDYGDDRLRVNFDSKPAPDMIAKLKQNGFKWSPTNTAWQRQLTDNAISTANYLFGTKIKTAASAMKEEVNKPRGDVIVPAPETQPQGNPMKAAFIAELDALKAETNIEAFDRRLDEIAGRIEGAGLMEELDAELNAAADVLTALLAEAEKAA
jgi:hypothetical protein